jgi:hypothetical protein
VLLFYIRNSCCTAALAINLGNAAQPSQWSIWVNRSHYLRTRCSTAAALHQAWQVAQIILILLINQQRNQP